MYMSLHNPTDAACTLIRDVCSKRKGMLDKAMQYCIHVLNSDAEPTSKDGILNIVGTVCNTLLKNKNYKVCTLRNAIKVLFPETTRKFPHHSRTPIVRSHRGL